MAQAAQLYEIATALRTTAGNYGTIGTDLDGVTLSLSLLMENLLTNWQGTSSQAFANACNRAWGDQQNVSISLGTASTALNAVATSIDDNIGPIEKFTNPAFQSYTIDPQELSTAQKAADTALAAIAAAIQHGYPLYHAMALRSLSAVCSVFLRQRSRAMQCLHDARAILLTLNADPRARDDLDIVDLSLASLLMAGAHLIASRQLLRGASTSGNLQLRIVAHETLGQLEANCSDLPAALRQKLADARARLWAAVQRVGDIRTSELWSWSYAGGR